MPPCRWCRRRILVLEIASTLTTPSEAGEGRLPLPGLSDLGSDIREMSSRCALHSGLLIPARRPGSWAKPAACSAVGKVVG